MPGELKPVFEQFGHTWRASRPVGKGCIGVPVKVLAGRGGDGAGEGASGRSMIIPALLNIFANEPFGVSELVGVSGEGERLTPLKGALLLEMWALFPIPDEFVFLD